MQAKYFKMLHEIDCYYFMNTHFPKNKNNQCKLLQVKLFIALNHQLKLLQIYDKLHQRIIMLPLKPRHHI
jgi:hypothetical protein